jgi:hypothetical protein
MQQDLDLAFYRVGVIKDPITTGKNESHLQLGSNDLFGHQQATKSQRI